MDNLAADVLARLYAEEPIDPDSDEYGATIPTDRLRGLLIAEAELDVLQPVLEALDEWRTMIGDYGLRPASDRVRDLVAAYDDYRQVLRFARGDG